MRTLLLHLAARISKARIEARYMKGGAHCSQCGDQMNITAVATVAVPVPSQRGGLLIALWRFAFTAEPQLSCSWCEWQKERS